MILTVTYTIALRRGQLPAVAVAAVDKDKITGIDPAFQSFAKSLCEVLFGGTNNTLFGLNIPRYSPFTN